MTPEYITDLFKKKSVVHNRQLRSVENDMLSIPRTKTIYSWWSKTVEWASHKYQALSFSFKFKK